MRSITGKRSLAGAAGAVGIAGQLAAAYVFILYPALTVPSPERYAFFLAWLVLVGLAVVWWHGHPWRSFAVPVTSVPIALLLLAIGMQSLGWGP